MFIVFKVFVIFIAGLSVILAIKSPTDDESFCYPDSNQDIECGAYALRVIKPVINYFAKLSNEIVTKDEEIVKLKNTIEANAATISQSKQQIIELTDKFAEISAVLSEKDRQISQLNDNFRKCQMETVSTVDKLESCNIQTLSINTTNQELQSSLTLCKKNKALELDNLQKKLEKFKKQQEKPSSCVDVGSYTGVIELQVDGLKSFLVPCESRIAGPGWTVIQRRINGEVDFYLDWKAYKEGFGIVQKEYWIGLERLYRLTNQQRFELYIQLVDQENETRYAKYDDFRIENEKEKYRLKSIGRYSGNASNSMDYHIESCFSTYDSDNDNSYYSVNCARRLEGGWWYWTCGDSNLNGKRFDCHIEDSNILEDTGCIFWQNWHGRSYSLKNVLMMIRPYNRELS